MVKSQNKEDKSEEKIDWEHLKIPAEVIKIVPYEAAKKYRFIPFEKEGKVLRVAVADMEILKKEVEKR